MVWVLLVWVPFKRKISARAASAFVLTVCRESVWMRPRAWIIPWTLVIEACAFSVATFKSNCAFCSA